MRKILTVDTCYQCRYGDNGYEDETLITPAWCYEASRKIEDLTQIPKWCPLPDMEVKP